jgi:hypothetical protein
MMYRSTALSSSQPQITNYKFYKTVIADSKEMKVELFNKTTCHKCDKLVKTDAITVAFSNPGQNVLVHIEDVKSYLQKNGVKKDGGTETGKLVSQGVFTCFGCDGHA